ncbi:MAG: tetratricopeptide repeat protein, partial [Rhizonema sp. PD38]|nr:tetratricopeptide repeat protein [Rhizonema sp. PD38]
FKVITLMYYYVENYSVYFKLGEKQQALSYFNKSLLLMREVGNKAGVAIILSNACFVYDNLGKKQLALSYYNQSLHLTQEVGDKAEEPTTLINIALLERNRGNLNAALTSIKDAINIIEDLRTKVVNQELRTSYFASNQVAYQFYIDLLMQLHKQQPSKGYNAQALHTSERARARSLLELLTESTP